MKSLIKREDTVVVNAGRSKGKRGRVLRVFPDNDRALVEGVNLITKATKPDPRVNQPGGFVKKESAVHLSNLLMYCTACDKGVRIKRARGPDGKVQRTCKKCGAILDKGKK